jgi:hypothetical protein
MNAWVWAILVAIICLSVTLWKRFQKPKFEPGTIVISEDVDSKEFSRVFAKALLHQTGRNILSPLLEASGNNFTSREMAILKYVLGEEDREFLISAISKEGPGEISYREAEILNRQMKILQSVVGEDQSHDPQKWSS